MWARFCQHFLGGENERVGVEDGGVGVVDGGGGFVDGDACFVDEAACGGDHLFNLGAIFDDQFINVDGQLIDVSDEFTDGDIFVVEQGFQTVEAFGDLGDHLFNAHGVGAFEGVAGFGFGGL